MMIRLLSLGLLLLVSTTRAEQHPTLTTEVFDTDIRPFLEEYCIRCHGADKQKADRRFDLLSYPIADEEALIDFQDALDLINLAEMPPEDEPQPSDEAQAATVAWLTAAIDKYQTESESTGGETVLRRLNRREYRHTIGDLFDIDMSGFDPTGNFPGDEEDHHLDNQGHALVTSGFLLTKYLEAADQVVEKALVPMAKPKPQVWVFNDNFKQGEFNGFLTDVQMREQVDNQLDHFRYMLRHLAERSGDDEIAKSKAKAAAIAQRIVKAADELPSHIRLYEHPRAERHTGSYGYVSDFSQGVPHDGYYFIAFDAEAMHRVPPYEKNYAGTNTDEPLTVGIVPGDIEVGPLHLPQEIEPELARFELDDGGRKKYETTVWLNKGQTPRFTYINGQHSARSAFIEVGTKLMAEAGLGEPENGNAAFVYGLQHGELPHVRIHHVYIKGPHYHAWPTQSQKDLLKHTGFDLSTHRDKLRNFLTKAYRRPVKGHEVDRIMKVIDTRVAQGVEPFQAYKDGLKAALCSPAFLYLEEPGEEQLSDYAIASRLSYFLWSSMPDKRLFDLAKAGTLSDPAVLQAETQRMLKDPKSDRFIEGFLNAWLTLSSLGETAPDRRVFRAYYTDGLESSMRRETQLFTRHLLDNDLSIDEFIKSDYTFVDRNLARFYGLDTEAFTNGTEFQKVSTLGKPRGGLLGQASVLTVTANGVDTSPIVRGVWLLENILGTPPTPPPPDIEPLDPDIRGAKTIREQMIKHRTDPTCAECHHKIDPLGFALENYDAIGRWRGSYRGSRKPIDTSGEMPSGATFTNVGEFKAALMKERGKFARGLTEKLMAYALGRAVEISDRPEIDAILADLEDNGRGFGYLVRRVVLSDAFVQP